MSNLASQTGNADPLPPELAALQATAIAADAALAGAALVPGAAPPPEVDKAAELGDLAALLVKIGGKALPTLPKYFPPDTCTEIAGAYIECADKYGWTWHEHLNGSPELKLGIALGVPAFLCFLETKEWLAWRRGQIEAEDAAARGGQPSAPAADGR